MVTADGLLDNGDLYIGLHLAQEKVQRFLDLAREMPEHLVPGAYMVLRDPDIWETISGFLENVTSGAWAWTLWQWLTTQVVDPIKFWITSDAPWGGRWMVDSTVRYFVAFLSDLESFALKWVSPYLTSFTNWIWGLPAQLAGTFLEWYGYGQAQVERLAAWWNTTVWPGISGMITAIGELPVELWSDFVGFFAWAKAQGERLSAWWAGLPGFVGTEVLPLLWTSVDDWFASPTGSFRSVWQLFLDGARGSAVDAIVGAKDLVRGWAGAFQELPATYLNYVAEVAGTDLAMNPGRALTTTGSLYTMSMMAGTAAHVLSTALNLVPTQNWVGAAQLSAYIAQAAGFDALTDATYGVLINDALSWPMRYHWNQVLRPKLPTEGTIFLMGRKRGLNREEFGEAMAYQGQPDWWIDKQYTFFWTDPSPYWLLRMSEHATPELHPSGLFLPWLEEWLPGWRDDPMAWFKMKLMLAGFEDTDIPAFIEGFQRRRVGPAITQVKTSVRAMVREAYWGREEAFAALRPLGVREEEIEYIMLAEGLDYQNRYLDDQVRYYIESYRKGEITKQDFALVLSTMIVKAERVAQIVAREDTRKLPKPKPIVEAREDPLVKSLVRQAATSWTAAFRDWKIDLEDLRLGLAIVLQDPDLADAMADVEAVRFRPEPPPPRLPVEDPVVAKSRRAAIARRIEQFREGVLDADQLEVILTALIPVPEIVVQVRQLEELRVAPVPGILPGPEEDEIMAAVREETVRGHIEMFRKRLIGLSELYTYLVADGLVEPLARATALTQALKRIDVPPLEAPYFQRDSLRALHDEAMASYANMLQLGQITLEEYEGYLAGVGVDPAVVTYLGDTQEVRAFARGY